MVPGEALLSALRATPGFDFTPDNSSDEFLVVYSATPTAFSRVACHVTAGTCFWFENVIRTSGAIATFDAQLPEPGTLALLGIGVAGLGLSRRRLAA
jgi:hypothetical protein